MAGVIHFNMLVELNQLLKEKGYSCSIHSVGGCSCSGVEVRHMDTSVTIQEVVEVINTYLKEHWLYVVVSKENQNILKIVSKFEWEKEIKDEII